jgi:hypothetical protein
MTKMTPVGTQKMPDRDYFCCAASLSPRMSKDSEKSGTAGLLFSAQMFGTFSLAILQRAATKKPNTKPRKSPNRKSISHPQRKPMDSGEVENIGSIGILNGDPE